MSDSPPPPSYRTAPSSLSSDAQELYVALLTQMEYAFAPTEDGPVQPAQLIPMKRGKKGRKLAAAENARKRRNMKPVQLLRGAGKYVPRAINCFMEMEDLLHYGPLMLWGTAPPNLSSEALAEHTYYKAALMVMLSTIPDFEPVLKQLYVDSKKDPRPWDDVVALLCDGFRKARQGDTSGLKGKLIYALPKSSDVLIPGISPDNKSERGFSHPLILYFLLPWKYRRHLPEPLFRARAASEPEPPVSARAEKVLKSIRDGTLEIKSTWWLSILYPDGEWDREDYTAGLFLSDFIVRILRHIWTSPSSAFVGFDKKMIGSSNCKLHGQFEVIPGMVAYAVVQGRVMLSKYDWAPEDPSGFDNTALYDAVMDIFEKPGLEQWSIDTRDKLRSRIFDGRSGSAKVAAAQVEADNEPDSDDEDEVAAQDARRAAAAANLLDA